MSKYRIYWVTWSVSHLTLGINFYFDTASLSLTVLSLFRCVEKYQCKNVLQSKMNKPIDLKDLINLKPLTNPKNPTDHRNPTGLANTWKDSVLLNIGECEALPQVNARPLNVEEIPFIQNIKLLLLSASSRSLNMKQAFLISRPAFVPTR